MFSAGDNFDVPLSSYQDLLDRARIQRGWSIVRQVKVFQSTTSTNDICWQAASSADAHGLLVIAAAQSAGRGRRGNAWLATPGHSALFSLLLKNAAPDPADAERLTLLAGLAAAEGLDRATGLRSQIKWPNDILLENVASAGGAKKVAGILVERRNADVVIGVGVNALQSAADFPPDLAPRATSCTLAAGRPIPPLPVISEILSALAGHFVRHDPDWLAHWKSRCATLGQRLPLQHAGRSFIAEIIDVDPLRGLIVRDDTGTMRFLSSALTTFSNDPAPK
jgi:BirA family transcriptional regulator, biotin operon repressor / biotin---[acetyl-CoA-carboxylase] ligase